MPPIQDELTCCLCPYLTDYGWVSEKVRDITVDKYVKAVSKLALSLDLHILTSVLKSLFWKIGVIQKSPDLVLLI